MAKHESSLDRSPTVCYFGPLPSAVEGCKKAVARTGGTRPPETYIAYFSYWCVHRRPDTSCDAQLAGFITDSSNLALIWEQRVTRGG
jgi:hypothetical protein